MADTVQIDMQQLAMDMTLDLANYPKHGDDQRLIREDLQPLPDTNSHPNTQWPSLTLSSLETTPMVFTVIQVTTESLSHHADSTSSRLYQS